jgi:hypothetical protein
MERIRNHGRKFLQLSSDTYVKGFVILRFINAAFSLSRTYTLQTTTNQLPAGSDRGSRSSTQKQSQLTLRRIVTKQAIVVQLSAQELIFKRRITLPAADY